MAKNLTVYTPKGKESTKRSDSIQTKTHKLK